MTTFVLAASRLRRQYWRYWAEPNPLEAWPPAAYRAIIGASDRMVDATYARRVIPERLGVAPIELASDHSPFLSATRHLADALVS